MREGIVQFACETVAFATHGKLLQRGRIMCEVGICLLKRLLLIAQSCDQCADKYTDCYETDRTNDGNENENKNISIIYFAQIDQPQFKHSSGDTKKDDMGQLILPCHKRKRNEKHG